MSFYQSDIMNAEMAREGFEEDFASINATGSSDNHCLKLYVYMYAPLEAVRKQQVLSIPGELMEDRLRLRRVPGTFTILR